MVALLATSAAIRLRRQTLELRPVGLVPAWSRVGDRDALSLPGRELVADLGVYDDEFYAYLIFTSLGGAPELRGAEVLLTYGEINGRIVYPVRAVLPNDLVGVIARLCTAWSRGLTQRYGGST